MSLAKKLCAIATVMALAAPARADDVRGTARAVAAKTSKAVVTARLVVKLSVGDREREEKLEITGTVIDPCGLTVVSASAIDPIGARMGGGRRGGGAQGDMPRIESKVAETALVLEDGTEIDADVVLKDAELDLAFIRPRDPATKLECVELKKTDAAPKALDEVFVIGRLGRVANHALSVRLGALIGVVGGPRPFYVCDELVSATGIGCVAYAADGSALGVVVTKRDSGSGRGRFESPIAIVRPVADVLELATQAKAAKLPEKKADEPKKEKKDDGKKTDDKKPEEGAKKPEAPAKKEDD